MRAALIETFKAPLIVRNVDEPACPPDGAVVSVQACGVCRSDWHAWTGADPDVSAPHVPGHEFAGVIEEVGRDCRRFRRGDRVTAPFILACGQCPDCIGGDPTVCNNQHVVGFSSWGAFAERIAVPRADFNLVHLPETIDFTSAAGMGCRVTTSFRAVVDRARLQPDEWQAINHASLQANDVNEAALKLAKALRTTKTLNVSGISDGGAAAREATNGGALVSLDALGITATFHNSIRGLRKLGRHVQIGMPLGRHAEPTVPLLELVYSRQISIMGTRGIAASRFPALFEMIAAGHLDPARLVTHTISLEEAGPALEAMNGYTGAGITVINRF